MGDVIKFYLRIYNPHLIIIRIQNLDDLKTQYVEFVDNQNHLSILQYLIGNEYTKINFTNIEEVTLNTVTNKQKMLKNKIIWNDMKLQEEPELSLIFQIHSINSLLIIDLTNLRLYPLEMRVFEVSL